MSFNRQRCFQHHINVIAQIPAIIKMAKKRTNSDFASKLNSIADKYNYEFPHCDVVDLMDFSVVKEGDFLSLLPDVASSNNKNGYNNYNDSDEDGENCQPLRTSNTDSHTDIVDTSSDSGDYDSDADDELTRIPRTAEVEHTRNSSGKKSHKNISVSLSRLLSENPVLPLKRRRFNSVEIANSFTSSESSKNGPSGRKDYSRRTTPRMKFNIDHRFKRKPFSKQKSPSYKERVAEWLAYQEAYMSTFVHK